VSNYTVHVPPPCEEEVRVIFADEHIIVVDKPAGLLSVPGRFVKDCVVQRLQFEYPDISVVHRLDLDTSGVLVFANSKLAVSALNRYFRERTIEKSYEALVYGTLQEEQGEIDLSLQPDPVNRPRQMVSETGKAALTRYQLLTVQDGCSRVSLKPVTGRSHQLRVHCAEIGHPILGCDLYAHQRAFDMASRLMLHARSLSFKHPLSHELMTFDTEVPF